MIFCPTQRLVPSPVLIERQRPTAEYLVELGDAEKTFENTAQRLTVTCLMWSELLSGRQWPAWCGQNLIITTHCYFLLKLQGTIKFLQRHKKINYYILT